MKTTFISRTNIFVCSSPPLPIWSDIYVYGGLNWEHSTCFLFYSFTVLLHCVSLVEWYYCTTGNRVQMPLKSLVVFLFFTLSPNKLFHGDTLSPNILKLFKMQILSVIGMEMDSSVSHLTIVHVRVYINPKKIVFLEAPLWHFSHSIGGNVNWSVHNGNEFRGEFFLLQDKDIIRMKLRN